MAGEFVLQQVHSFGAPLPVLSYWTSARTHLLRKAPKEGVTLDDKGYLSYEAVFFSPILTIWPKRGLSAFSMISFAVLLLSCTFLLSSKNVCRFDFFKGSWNFTLGGFASRRYTRNSWYAFLPTLFAFSRSSSISFVATFPLDKHSIS